MIEKRQTIKTLVLSVLITLLIFKYLVPLSPPLDPKTPNLNLKQWYLFYGADVTHESSLLST